MPKAPIRTSGDLAGQMFVDLGRLRAFKGSQRYAIPAGLDLSKFQSVIIWCEQFSVLISPADLKRKARKRPLSDSHALKKRCPPHTALVRAMLQRRQLHSEAD